MKKVVIIAALATLAACSQKTEKAAEADAAPVEAATATVTDSASLTGDFDVKMADGKMAKTTINADGTYRDENPGTLPVAGVWAIKDGKTCFDPSGKDPEECMTTSAPGADGSFTATAPDGTVLTVKPVKK